MEKVLVFIMNCACYVPLKVMRVTPNDTIAWIMRGFHFGTNAYCTYIVLTEPLSPLSLSYHSGTPLFPIFFILQFITQLFYIIATFQNPGYVTKEEMLLDRAETTSKNNEIDIESGERAFKVLKDKPKFNMKERSYCEPCGWAIPLRAIHCRTCEKCVRRYDHHCPWLGNCVGERNYRFFYLYVIFQTSVVYILTYSTYFSFYDTVTNWFWFHKYLILSMMILSVCAPTSTAVFIFHNYMIVTGQTTYEVVKHSKIPYLQSFPNGVSPFNRGILMNYYLMLIRVNPTLWENLYTS